MNIELSKKLVSIKKKLEYQKISYERLQKISYERLQKMHKNILKDVTSLLEDIIPEDIGFMVDTYENIIEITLINANKNSNDFLTLYTKLKFTDTDFNISEILNVIENLRSEK